jgi:hypothetical protein
MTKAALHNDGRVVWSLPAILRSSCKIDVEFFPFDEQSCFIKFASWTYDSDHLTITHVKAKEGESIVPNSIDRNDYAESDEWDIMDIVAQLNREQISSSSDNEVFSSKHHFKLPFT